MNQLYWKEWREQRMVMAALPLVNLLLLIGYASFKGGGLIDSGERTPVLYSGAVLGSLFFTGLVAAALCGSLVMAPEVNAGTLRFLTMLPITRGRIWRGKVLAGGAAAGVSIAGAALIGALASAVMGGLHQFDALPGEFFRSLTYGNGGEVMLAFLCLALLAYSTGCYVTMLLERPINAVLGTIALSVLVAALLSYQLGSTGEARQLFQFASLYPFSAWCAVVSIVFLWMSYRTFLLGETLQTSKRFSLLLWPRALGDILLVAAALMIGYLWIMS